MRMMMMRRRRSQPPSRASGWRSSLPRGTPSVLGVLLVWKMMMLTMMMIVIIAGFIPRYTHSHIVYSSQREEYLFLLKAYCCCSLEDGFAATVSPSLPMHMLREPHSINPHHLAARSDATVTKRTHRTSWRERTDSLLCSSLRWVKNPTRCVVMCCWSTKDS